jgi:acyl-coenzyme A thioesterase PaaI-like protein
MYLLLKAQAIDDLAGSFNHTHLWDPDVTIFSALPGSHRWQPSPLAAGPFAGLQGGAVASLLTAEVEAMAAERDWGAAISVTVWYLRPTPLAALRTQPVTVAAGGRVTVVDNVLWSGDETQPCAMARVTLARERPIAVAGLPDRDAKRSDPTLLPERTRRAPHGRPWFMDAMEARAGDGIGWIRMRESVVDGAGPLTGVLGAADWTHGINRPVEGAVADPNPNLTVHLFRNPVGEWIGISPQTRWQAARGTGIGHGVLFDIEGEIGCVSMSVVLLPFPKS